MAKLRFLKSHGYGGTIIRAGAVIEVSDVYAARFIQDGVAIPSELTQEVKVEPTETVTKPIQHTIKRRGRGKR